MIPELGHFSLILALMVAGLQMHPLLCYRAAFLQFTLCLSAFLALMWAYIVSDFTVLNVAENSHTLKPVLHKITALWSNHKGAMLLWLLILSFFSALAAFKKTDMKILRMISVLSVCFIIYTLFFLNPFERIDPPPFDGMASYLPGEPS